MHKRDYGTTTHPLDLGSPSLPQATISCPLPQPAASSPYSPGMALMVWNTCVVGHILWEINTLPAETRTLWKN